MEVFKSSLIWNMKGTTHGQECLQNYVLEWEKKIKRIGQKYVLDWEKILGQKYQLERWDTLCSRFYFNEIGSLRAWYVGGNKFTLSGFQRNSLYKTAYPDWFHSIFQCRSGDLICRSYLDSTVGFKDRNLIKNWKISVDFTVG